MELIFRYLLLAAIIISSVLSVYYSFKSRRKTDVTERSYFGALNNIYMGISTMLVASLLVILFSSSTLKVVIAALAFLLGLFNTFAGSRNYSRLKKIREQS